MLSQASSDQQVLAWAMTFHMKLFSQHKETWIFFYGDLVCSCVHFFQVAFHLNTCKAS